MHNKQGTCTPDLINFHTFCWHCSCHKLVCHDALDWARLSTALPVHMPGTLHHKLRTARATLQLPRTSSPGPAFVPRQLPSLVIQGIPVSLETRRRHSIHPTLLEVRQQPIWAGAIWRGLCTMAAGSACETAKEPPSSRPHSLPDRRNKLYPAKPQTSSNQ